MYSPPEEGVFVPTCPGDVFCLVTGTFVISIQGISTCGDSHSERTMSHGKNNELKRKKTLLKRCIFLLNY